VLRNLPSPLVDVDKLTTFSSTHFRMVMLDACPYSGK